MRIERSTRLSFLLTGGLGLALLVGCSGSSTPSNNNGAMNVTLVDGPINGYLEINVNIQTVEINSGGGWVTLSSPNKTVNLLSLTGGISEILASGATLPAGHYSQMRLILGTGNTVKLADGTVQPLVVPSGLQSGIKLIGSFDVAKGTTEDVWIDFDAAHSIQIVNTGASNKYILRPTVKAYDKIVTGSVSGIFTDSTTSTGLAGAMVYAETLDASGNPVIARSTVTNANGAYTLDLLPVGATYYVVSQPKVGTTTVKAYDAKVSGALALSTSSSVLTFTTSFIAEAAVGTVSGGITPVAATTPTQSDSVNLMQSLNSQSFIVDSTMATVGLTSETYMFGNVPVGAYSLQGTRSTLNADGTTTLTVSLATTATVTPGVITTVNFSF